MVGNELPTLRSPCRADERSVIRRMDVPHISLDLGSSYGGSCYAFPPVGCPLCTGEILFELHHRRKKETLVIGPGPFSKTEIPVVLVANA